MKTVPPVRNTIIRRTGRTHFEGELFESLVKNVAVSAAAHLTQATLLDVTCKRCRYAFKAKDVSAEGYCSRCAYQNTLDLRIQQRLIPQVKTIGGAAPTSGAMWDVP